MMQCFNGLVAEPALWVVLGVSIIAALVLFLIVKFQKFQGKFFYSLTFIAMIWTLLLIGLESASTSYACQMQWATLAWLGNGLLPVSWCFFVFSYIGTTSKLESRSAMIVLCVIPISICLLAATNQFHGLFYTDTSTIPPGNRYIAYDHGPIFYGSIATLYTFVMATLFYLLKSLMRAKPSAWPLLTMLIVITTIPLIANAAYIALGFTVFGLDPTAFMFTFALLPFTWMLAMNKTMDMAFVSQSVLFNTMSEPVILIDRHKNISLLNTAAKSYGLHQRSDSIMSEIVHNIDTPATSEGVAYLTINQRIYEPRIRHIESPLNPKGPALGWSITFVDVTERIANSATLENALKRADEANKAKDEFISVVSHELRTPLTSLTGGLTLALSGRVGEVPAPVRSLLNIAHRNSGRLSRLIDNILLAQKIEIDALVLESKPVDLMKLLQESFEENTMFATERDVRLKLGIVMPAVVTGDAFAIRQIIDNLISNAIKFSNKGGIVEGMLSFSESRTQLSITNAGQGIPDGMETRVFGRFAQIENSHQASTQGSGLGLHISKKLAEQMSGDIYYESGISLPTTFHVWFPMRSQNPIMQAQQVSDTLY